MRTFTFAINGVAEYSNLTRCLPGRFRAVVDGEEALFIQTGAHNAPVFSAGDNDAPDITLLMTMADSEKSSVLQLLQPANPSGGILQITRVRKAVYNKMLNDVFGNIEELKGYIPIKPITNYHLLPEGDIQWVARAPMGARGKGFSLVPKDRSVDWFRTQALLACQKNDPSFAEDQGVKVEADSFEAVHDETRSKVTVLGEVSQSEYVPFIENIAYELRLITDHNGRFALGCMRDRVLKSNGMMMAVGSENKPSNCFIMKEEGIATALDGSPISNIPIHVVRLIEKLSHAQHSIRYIPLHSFDLFVCNDGGWGFFEASCEYGECGIPNGWTFAQAKLYMAKLATELLQEGLYDEERVQAT